MGTRVLLGDSHQIIRAGLRVILARQPQVDVVGEADDGRSIVELAEELAPDVVIMDISMPGLDGVEAMRQIVGSLPAVKIIALATYGERHHVTEALKAGAMGYLLKSCAAEELGLAIRAVKENRVYLSSMVTSTLVKDYLKRPNGNGEEPDGAKLTPREREVLQMIAEGGTSKEIAATLRISVRTIDTHRQQIMDKLKIRTVAQLTKYAVREGLTPLEA